MLSLLYFLAILPSFLTFDCDLNGPEITLTGNKFPPDGGNGSYLPATKCLWKIPKVAGKYISLSVDSIDPSNGQLTFTDQSGLSIVYTPEVASLEEIEMVTPIDMHISFISLQLTGGKLSFSWNYRPIPYRTNSNARLKTSPGQPGVLLKSQDVYQTSTVVTVDTFLSVQAASRNQPLYKNLMINFWVFAGEGIDGDYLGSLYNFEKQGKTAVGTPRNTSTTITLVNVISVDYGIVLIKAFADVQYYYSWLYWADENVTSSSFSRSQSSVDAGTNLYASTYYSPTYSDIYLTSVSCSDGNAVVWQAGDLLPNLTSTILGQWDGDNTLEKLPQAIPGQLKTVFFPQGCRPSFQINYPDAYSKIPGNTSSFFTSANFPFSGLDQNRTIEYRTATICQMSAGQLTPTPDGSYISVSVSNGSAPAHSYIIPKSGLISLIGDHFTFQYVYGTNRQNNGVMAKFTFLPLGPVLPDGGTGAPNSDASTTPKTSGSFEKASSMIFLLILLKTLWRSFKG